MQYQHQCTTDNGYVGLNIVDGRIEMNVQVEYGGGRLNFTSSDISVEQARYLIACLRDMADRLEKEAA